MSHGVAGEPDDGRVRQDAERREEEHAIGRVVAALGAAFPGLSETDVADCVGRIHATFAQARVRTYVPILVEREARAALAAWLTGAGQAPRLSSIATASGPEDAGF
jgi:hypothetical protein